MGEQAAYEIARRHGIDIADDEPRNHGKPWTAELDHLLLQRWRRNMSVPRIAELSGRTRGSISSRLQHLGVLCDDMGRPVAYDGTNDPTPRNLPATPKENIMNVKMTHLITLLQKDYTTITVQFNKADAKHYTYKAPLSMTLVEGDRVVVHGNDTLQVARVSAVHDEPQIDFDQPYALKWVVQRVDLTAYEEQQAREAAALAMIVKADKLKKQQDALDALLGSGTSREELLKLLNGG